MIRVTRITWMITVTRITRMGITSMTITKVTRMAGLG